MNITVVGSGYVGISIGVLLAQSNKVTFLEIDKEKISKINAYQSTVSDDLIDKYFKTKNLDIFATDSKQKAYADAEVIIVAVPTSYDEVANKFDLSIINKVLSEAISYNDNSLIIIKSTIPIGYTKDISEKLNTKNIVFSPEFLREGFSLYDCLYPSRIIFGGTSSKIEKFKNNLISNTKKEGVDILYMSSCEAEAVKLFANSYLAMRVSFFNELDTYALDKNLNTKSIIEGVSLDPRIGEGYNNPSFGYGGYCLPKDTKQLLYNFQNIPQSIISGIVKSNNLRIKHISELIINFDNKTIGFYRLSMKAGSDNIRSSSSYEVIKKIKELHSKNVEIIIFEPLIMRNEYEGCNVVNDFEQFIEKSDLIVANRLDEDIKPYKNKVFTRDIYNIDE